MADRLGPHVIEDHLDPDTAQLSLNAGSDSEQLSTAESERPSPPETQSLPIPETEPSRARRLFPSSRSVVAAFLESLPIVKPENLPENSQDCHICKERFDNQDPGVVENNEFAVKLPCDHIMGSKCLAKWFEGNNSCPMCRAASFSQDVSPHAELLGALNLHLLSWSAASRHLAREEQRETLAASVSINELDMRSLSALAAENTGHLTRLSEIQAGPENEESWAETARIAGRIRANDARLRQIEGRIRFQRRGAQGGPGL